MNKKLRELLAQINGKKTEVRNLVAENKVEEATKAKEELQALQAKFDLLKDIEDPEGDGTIPEPENSVPVPATDAIHEFAEAARHRFMNINREGAGIDGGYTVPEDIQTRINKWREAEFSLQSLVSTEEVTTMSGARTYQKKAQHTGFSSVAEGGKIGKKTGPQFERITYTITKYGGYLPVTNELLEDSDANISGTLIEWLGKEDVATRNALILAAVATKAQTALTGLDDIKAVVNVTLGQVYAGGVVVTTNDDGLNYLDTLKDENGRYLLQPDINPANPFNMSLAIGARRVPVMVVPNAILATASNKIPFIIGDLKEYCRIYDRKKLTIKVSDIAQVGSGDDALNAFEDDLTLFRGILRLDCEVVDGDAIVNGYISNP